LLFWVHEVRRGDAVGMSLVGALLDSGQECWAPGKWLE
jgi:hypothetical protein